MNCAVQLASLRQPFRKALLTAARLGARSVEIDCLSEVRAENLSESGVQHVRKLLADTDLRVAAAAFRTRHGYDVLEGLERRIDATRQAMRLAYALGARVLVNFVGAIPTDDADARWPIMIEALSDLGRFSQHVGVQLAAQTGSETGEELARLINRLPTGSLVVALDPGLAVVNGFSPAETLTALQSHVAYAYATDAVRDLAQRRGLEVPLGRGTANLPLLCAQLSASRYSGYWCVQRPVCANPELEIRQALAFMNNME